VESGLYNPECSEGNFGKNRVREERHRVEKVILKVKGEGGHRPKHSQTRKRQNKKNKAKKK